MTYGLENAYRNDFHETVLRIEPELKNAARALRTDQETTNGDPQEVVKLLISKALVTKCRGFLWSRLWKCCSAIKTPLFAPLSKTFYLPGNGASEKPQARV